MEEEREEGELPPSPSPPPATTPSSPAAGVTWPLLPLDLPPRRALHFRRQFLPSDGGNGNFLKCLRWSPDGSSFLTSSDDNTLRVFALAGEFYGDLAGAAEASVDGEDSYGPSVVVSEAESVYDFCWYPYMSAADPAMCVFASTTRDHPIHLWDAFTGELRCTYRAYDSMDEITVALSVAFDSSGTKLFAGYNKCFRVFDTHCPGRDFEQYLLKGMEGFSGIVSSITFSPTNTKMLATGSYSQTTAIYGQDNMELLYVLHGQTGGVTQVLFSQDGNYLYTGGRRVNSSISGFGVPSRLNLVIT